MDYMPPFQPQIMQCASAAATEYQVPRVLLLAIIKTESSGNVSAVGYNTNGTKDVGPMQINSSWAQRLESRYGIRNASGHLTKNPCYNIRVGAWILRSELVTNASQPFWHRVGNYHSKTPRFNAAYRDRVYKNMVWIINNTNWTA